MDTDFDSRPGVPMEASPLRPGVSIPPAQPLTSRILTPPRRGLTPIFGTRQPPRALSGRVRSIAHRLPETRASHWMLLLGADRIDQWEHRLAGMARGDVDDYRSLGRYLLRHPVRTAVLLAVSSFALRRLVSR